MGFFQTFLLSPAVLVALIGAGCCFCIRLRFFWVLHPVRTCRILFSRSNGGGAFRAVCMALAGTLGVGNIAGVALALIGGGPGAVFWMLLSAFFAMAVKYAEVALAMDTRIIGQDGWQGGTHFYMRAAGRAGKWLSPVFAVLCLVCAIFQGSVIQGNAVAEALSLSIGVKPCFTGIALTVVTALVLLFGRRGVRGATSVLIPVVTLIYLIMCFSVVIQNHAGIPAALSIILRSAFTPRAEVAGIFGCLTSEAARLGCARGLLSNEAGCGTAPMAHITAASTTPGVQGLWGIFEVFLDTAVICLLTALACLTVAPTGQLDAPLAYVCQVFASFYGGASIPLVAFVIVSFAFATTLTWAYYGVTCLASLTRRPTPRRLYLFAYCSSLSVGALCTPTVAYAATDLLLGVMTLCNLAVLIKKADRVVALSAHDGLLCPPKLNRKRGYDSAVQPPTLADAPDCPHTPVR